MGTRTSYPPGTFSWVDLATSDPDAARSFYTSLFGWDADNGDDGAGGTYTTFRTNGDAVCGLTSTPPGASGPAWTNYVTVADADEAAARAGELGGVSGPAFDVMDLGRMAVLTDPQGAAFALWQPKASIGAERVNDLGCLTMNELVTTDIDAARSFYEQLFGWRTEAVDTGPDGPVIVSVYNGDTLNASLGIAAGVPPHWRPYFTVTSTEAAVERVRALGGSLLFGPFPIPAGSMAGVLDPQGAVFALFEGEVDP
jgi:predicted enzyme related to lactoylglutathione lyase